MLLLFRLLSAAGVYLIDPRRPFIIYERLYNLEVNWNNNQFLIAQCALNQNQRCSKYIQHFLT